MTELNKKNNYPKRVKFPRGQQKKFLEYVKNKLRY